MRRDLVGKMLTMRAVRSKFSWIRGISLIS